MIKSTEQKRKIEKTAFFISILCMLLLSLTFLIMPVASNILLNKGSNKLLIATGVMFWLFLALAYFLLGFVDINRRKFLKQHKKAEKKRLPGILRLFSNPAAKCADIVSVVSLVLLVILSFITDNFANYILLAVFAFSFQMHCVLNGENCLYINSLKAEENKNAQN